MRYPRASLPVARLQWRLAVRPSLTRLRDRTKRHLNHSTPATRQTSCSRKRRFCSARLQRTTRKCTR
eukprot:scaffold26353_cov68-Phaeocystis_antarctica.AAC.3